jgi:hypothetical protein
MCAATTPSPDHPIPHETLHKPRKIKPASNRGLVVHGTRHKPREKAKRPAREPRASRRAEGLELEQLGHGDGEESRTYSCGHSSRRNPSRRRRRPAARAPLLFAENHGWGRRASGARLLAREADGWVGTAGLTNELPRCPRPESVWSARTTLMLRSIRRASRGPNQRFLAIAVFAWREPGALCWNLPACLAPLPLMETRTERISLGVMLMIEPGKYSLLTR